MFHCKIKGFQKLTCNKKLHYNSKKMQQAKIYLKRENKNRRLKNNINKI